MRGVSVVLGIRRLCLSGILIACLATCAVADVVTIPDVPAYLWYNGCGPTAAGMVIGYWDAHGYGNLISGSNSWSANQAAVKAMIASPGHIRDYVPTPDRVATVSDPYHPDDCVADFSQTSWSSQWVPAAGEYGWGWFSLQDDGLAGYASYRGYDYASARNVYYADNLWTKFVAEIDAQRPVELLVDKNGDGISDHFVAAIGYDDTPGAERYACYNTYTQSVSWYGFQGMGSSYGIYGATFFDPGALPGDANNNGLIDGADLMAWQNNYDPLGLSNNSFAGADWNGDGKVDGSDLALWQQNYTPLGDTGMLSRTTLESGLGEVPEPASASLLIAGMSLTALLPRRKHKGSAKSFFKHS
jgi:hypothetical protein